MGIGFGSEFSTEITATPFKLYAYSQFQSNSIYLIFSLDRLRYLVYIE